MCELSPVDILGCRPLRSGKMMRKTSLKKPRPNTMRHTSRVLAIAVVTTCYDEPSYIDRTWWRPEVVS